MPRFMLVVQTAALAAVLLLLTHPCRAQENGRGSLGANQLEPRLELLHSNSGNDFEARVDRLGTLPAGASVQLLISTRGAAIPLTGLGLPDAVLGVDPRGMFLLGPLPVSASGVASLQIKLQPAWKGGAIHVQAVVADLRIAQPHLAFSDSRSVVLGTDGDTIVIARDAAPLGVDLIRLQRDGSPGIDLPGLKNVTLRDLDLVAIDESFALRSDTPSQISVGSKRAVRLADGSTFMLVQHGNRDVFVRVWPTGHVDVVGEAAQGTYAPAVVASASHVAFCDVAGSRLWILKTDGANWPGSADPLREVRPTGYSGIEASAMCLGARVLAVSSRFSGLLFVPLDGSKHFAPQLAPSGGRTPVVFDEELAMSGDGRRFALGAGSDRKIKDIYVIADDGKNQNVSKKPGDYGEVGYDNPGRRTEIVLDHSGNLVSFVDENGKEPECFVVDLSNSTRSWLTTSVAFVDSIDIGSTSRFPVKGGALVFAGLDANSIDLFFTPTVNDRDMIPMTNTGGDTQMPFARRAKLTLLDLASTTRGDVYALRARRAGKFVDEVWLVEPQAKRSRLVASEGGHMLALSDGHRFLVDGDRGVIVVDPSRQDASFARRIDLGAGTVQALLRLAPTDFALVSFGTATSRTLHLVDPNTGRATTVDPTPSATGEIFAGTRADEAHILSAPGQNGRTLLRWTRARGIQNLGGSKLLFFVQRP